MNRIFLALLFIVALTGTAGDSGWKDFDAPADLLAEVQNNPGLQPGRQTRRRFWRSGPPSGTPDSLGAIHGTPLNLATAPNASLTHKIKTFLDTRMIQETCLATAVYFEARSESMVGQLAVAMVILNRVKASNSPFLLLRRGLQGCEPPERLPVSFACDGKPDIVDDARAWMAAHAVTALALANDRKAGRYRFSPPPPITMPTMSIPPGPSRSIA